MSILQRGSTTSATATTAAQVVSKPTGVIAGDVEYAMQYDGVTAPTLLAGWTQIISGTDGGTSKVLFSAKLAGGAEPASYTFTAGSTVNTVALSAFSGANQATLFEQASIVLTNNAVPNSVTPTQDNSVQILFYGIDVTATVTTAPSGGPGTYALLAVVSNTGFGTLAIYSRTLGVGTAGTVIPAPTTGIVWSTGTTKHAGTFVIKPAAVITTPGGGFKKLLLALGYFSVLAMMYPVAAPDIGGWTTPVPVTATGATTALLMDQAQAGSRLYYVANTGTNPASSTTWAGTGLQGNGAGEVYFWNGTNIIDSNNQTSPGGVGTLYGTDPTQPSSSVKAFKNWSWVCPRRTGGVIGSASTELCNGLFTSAVGRVASPDMWYFKAGDTFDLKIDLAVFTADGSLGIPGGADATHIQVLARYGPLTAARPKFIHPSANYGFVYRSPYSGGQLFNNVVFSGIEFNGHDRPGALAGDSFNVQILGTTTADRNILWEDMNFTGGSGFIWQLSSGTMKFRRCLLRDAFHANNHGSGMYLQNTQASILQIDDCLIGRNGFATDPSISNSAFQTLARNLYADQAIDRTNSYIKNTVFLYGASADQIRCGIPLENCFFMGDISNSVQGATYLYDNLASNPLKITGITGNGVTTTVTTNATAFGGGFANWNIGTGTPLCISGSGLAGFDVTDVAVTVLNTTQFTYPSAGNGTPSQAFVGIHGDSQGHTGVPPAKNCIHQAFINPTNLNDPDTSGNIGNTYGGSGIGFGMGWQTEEAFGLIYTAAGLAPGTVSAGNPWGFSYGSQGWYNLYHNKLTGFNLHDNIGYGTPTSVPLGIQDGMNAGVAGNPSYDSFVLGVTGVLNNTHQNSKYVAGAGTSVSGFHTYTQYPGGSATDVSNTTETLGLIRYATTAAAKASEVTWLAPDRTWKTYMATLMPVSSKDGTVEAYATWDTMQRGQWRSDMQAKAPVNYVRAGFGLAALP